MADRDGEPGAITGNDLRPSAIPSDRRLLRGELTRMVIVHAMIDLVEAKNSLPTSRQVAERAGVCVRLIFYHFPHVEAVFHDAAAAQVSRHRVLVAFVPPRGPIDVRMRATCRQRRHLFEALAPMLRVADSRFQVSPGLVPILGGLWTLLQLQLTVTFGPEIASRDSSALVLLETLDLATAWPTWSKLRFQSGHSASSAEQLMACLAIPLLG